MSQLGARRPQLLPQPLKLLLKQLMRAWPAPTDHHALSQEVPLQGSSCQNRGHLAPSSLPGLGHLTSQFQDPPFPLLGSTGDSALASRDLQGPPQTALSDSLEAERDRRWDGRNLWNTRARPETLSLMSTQGEAMRPSTGTEPGTESSAWVTRGLAGGASWERGAQGPLEAQRCSSAGMLGCDAHMQMKDDLAGRCDSRYSDSASMCPRCRGTRMTSAHMRQRGQRSSDGDRDPEKGGQRS